MQYTIEPKQGKAYDVIVCGGGTAGCFAAIAAARAGASVLLLERTFSVGGMLTVGEAGITKFTEHCKDRETYRREVADVLAVDPRSVQVVGGIPHEYCMRMIYSGGALGTNGECGSYIFTDRYCAQLTLIDMLKEAGADVLYDTRVCLVNKEGEAVRGVIAVNKEGFTEYSAKCVIDCTGDADVAALADVECYLGASEADVAEGAAKSIGQLQYCGVMYRVGGVDFERLFAYLDTHPENYRVQGMGQMSLDEVKDAHRRGEMAVFCLYLTNPETGTKGGFQVYNTPEEGGAILLSFNGLSDLNRCECNPLDATALSAGQDHLLHGAQVFTKWVQQAYPGFENARVTYVPDIGVRESRHIVGKYKITALDVMLGRDFEDSVACGGHSVDMHPRPKEIENMEMNHWRFHIPYRVMVPEKVENLLVAGRCVSASRVASGAIRPTAQCMALGEAAGIAAAMCAKAGITPAQLDVHALRRTLTENGAIV